MDQEPGGPVAAEDGMRLFCQLILQINPSQRRITEELPDISVRRNVPVEINAHRLDLRQSNFALLRRYFYLADDVVQEIVSFRGNRQS